MSHEMTELDQMFSVRDRPWHFDETNSFVLADYPGREEAMKVAGHDFTVVELPVFERLGDEYVPLEGFKVRRNSKTGHTFSVVNSPGLPWENELGWDIAETVLDQDSVRWETAGTLKDGTVCWVVARIDEPEFIQGDDSAIYPYVAVSWSHDGSHAMKARATSVRVVCWNTLSMAEAEASRTGREFTFKNTKNARSRIEDARDALRHARAEHHAFMELASELVQIPVSNKGIARFMSEFGPTAQPTKGEVSNRVQTNIDNARGEFMGILNSGITITADNRNTAYGLVQAGVEFLDHVRGYRSQDTYCRRTILRDEPAKGQLVNLARRVADEEKELVVAV